MSKGRRSVGVRRSFDNRSRQFLSGSVEGGLSRLQSMEGSKGESLSRLQSMEGSKGVSRLLSLEKLEESVVEIKEGWKEKEKLQLIKEVQLGHSFHVSYLIVAFCVALEFQLLIFPIYFFVCMDQIGVSKENLPLSTAAVAIFFHFSALLCLAKPLLVEKELPPEEKKEQNDEKALLLSFFYLFPTEKWKRFLFPLLRIDTATTGTQIAINYRTAEHKTINSDVQETDPLLENSQAAENSNLCGKMGTYHLSQAAADGNLCGKGGGKCLLSLFTIS